MPGSNGDSVTERPCGDLHAGRLGGIRMALQDGVERAKSGQNRGIEETAMGEYRIQHGAGVTLAEKQPVPIDPIRPLRIDMHVVEVEACENFRNRERTPDVPALVLPDHVQDIDARLQCADRDVLDQLLSMVMHMVPPDESDTLTVRVSAATSNA